MESNSVMTSSSINLTVTPSASMQMKLLLPACLSDILPCWTLGTTSSRTT